MTTDPNPYECPACQVEAMEGINVEGSVSLACANSNCRVLAFSPEPREYLGL